MARARTIVGVVALFSMLLNAAVLVRHHWNVLDAHARYAEFAADLTVICHGHGGETGAPAEREAPFPGPAKASDCPVCKGLCSTVAILTERQSPFLVIPDQSLRLSAMSSAIASRLAGEWPPPRGPPLSA